MDREIRRTSHWSDPDENRFLTTSSDGWERSATVVCKLKSPADLTALRIVKFGQSRLNTRWLFATCVHSKRLPYSSQYWALHNAICSGEVIFIKSLEYSPFDAKKILLKAESRKFRFQALSLTLLTPQQKGKGRRAFFWKRRAEIALRGRWYGTLRGRFVDGWCLNRMSQSWWLEGFRDGLLWKLGGEDPDFKEISFVQYLAVGQARNGSHSKFDVLLYPLHTTRKGEDHTWHYFALSSGEAWLQTSNLHWAFRNSNEVSPKTNNGRNIRRKKIRTIVAGLEFCGEIKKSIWERRKLL